MRARRRLVASRRRFAAARRRRPCALGALLCQLVLIACGSDRPAAPEPAARAPSALSQAPAPLAAADQPPAGLLPPAPAPPAVAFVAPQPWQSKREGTPPIDPPPLPTWRAMASQNQPLQVKTPHWQPLPPAETVELQMPPQSGFRCVVTPLQVTAEANDFGTKLKAWVLARSLLCSGDGFQRWTEHVHTERLAADGSREEPPESGVLLRERDGQGTRHSYVLLRSSEESRAATTGPPRVLAGVKVDED